MCKRGWKYLGVLELPSIDQERWVLMVKETDALLVNGDPLQLLAAAKCMPPLRLLEKWMSRSMMVGL